MNDFILDDFLLKTVPARRLYYAFAGFGSEALRFIGRESYENARRCFLPGRSQP